MAEADDPRCVMALGAGGMTQLRPRHITMRVELEEAAVIRGSADARHESVSAYLRRLAREDRHREAQIAEYAKNRRKKAA